MSTTANDNTEQAAAGAPTTDSQQQQPSSSQQPSAQPPQASSQQQGGVTAAAAGADDSTAAPALPESKMPTRKDTSLKEFLNKMDDYAPIIPDAVTNYYMTKAGLPPPPQTDPRLARLIALAVQKFVADVAADSYQYSRIRASNTATNNPMGNLGAAAGIPMPGQAAGGGSSKDQGKGGPLGIQRAGYGGGGQGGSQNRTVLTMEDLGMAVGEYGVNVKRSEFYR
ncbi:transcription initiation factor TFIID 23-30kDa subunit-domain-containing protein [Microdochium bolleyi]|uniref:Transcription initiation factor TFIID subunit 10 n=1 Tax=Microdochium bolleyi TaxID=196109 RepID=A0A136JJS5_9PEZI|nr:transcription initiation factor TFIID 23-30kDa subunit-domain-containing protein [Microdochium bolleyi]